jgi:hypothetical protein
MICRKYFSRLIMPVEPKAKEERAKLWKSKNCAAMFKIKYRKMAKFVHEAWINIVKVFNCAAFFVAPILPFPQLLLYSLCIWKCDSVGKYHIMSNFVPAACVYYGIGGMKIKGR